MKFEIKVFEEIKLKSNKMNCTKISCKIGLVIVLIFILVSTVSALTASIGNGRMVIRANAGDSIDRYVLVKNVNDVSVKINMTVDGDLEKSITLKENYFILGPGEEKKAYFTIYANKNGTTETNINVGFKPTEGKESGVGLHSTVIVITSGDSVDSPEPGEVDTGETIGGAITRLTGNVIGEGKSSLVVFLLGMTTIVLVIIFIFLMARKNKAETLNNSKRKKA